MFPEHDWEEALTYVHASEALALTRSLPEWQFVMVGLPNCYFTCHSNPFVAGLYSGPPRRELAEWSPERGGGAGIGLVCISQRGLRGMLPNPGGRGRPGGRG